MISSTFEKMLFSVERFSATMASNFSDVCSRLSTVRWMLSKAVGNPSVASASKTALRFSKMSSTPSMSWSVLFLSGINSMRTASARPTSKSLKSVSPGCAASLPVPAMRLMALVPNRSLEMILAVASLVSSKADSSMSKPTKSEPSPSSVNFTSVTCPTLNPFTNTGLDTASPSIFS